MILCIGELLIDFVCTDSDTMLKDSENFLKKAGGAPLNVSVAIQKLGSEAYMCGAVGKDPFGDILVEMLETYKVNTNNVLRSDKYNTTLAFVSLTSSGERDFNFVRGADEHFTFSDIDNDTKIKSEIFHFGSATAFLGGELEKCYYDALNYAAKNNKFISFDPNYREALFGDKKALFVKHSKEFIKHSNIVKVSDEEAIIITGKSDVNDAIKDIINLGATYVVMTLGKDGTLLASYDNVKIIPTNPVKMVDSTGAGDSFIGAVLSKIQLNNCNVDFKTMEDFVVFGNKVGAKTVTAYGALTAMPFLSDFE